MSRNTLSRYEMISNLAKDLSLPKSIRQAAINEVREIEKVTCRNPTELVRMAEEAQQ